MAKFQLVIDDQIADIYSEKDLSVTYSISEVTEIENRLNPTTSTIKIPGTKRNCKIFGYPEVLDTSGFKGQKTLLTGSISVDGTEIIIGLVNLKNVNRSGEKLEFEISIIGNSGEWVSVMKDADLKGIALGGTHDKTEANINASLAGDQVYIYPLVNFGFTGGQLKIGKVEDDGNGKAKFIIDGTNTVYGLRTNIAAGDLIYGVSFSLASYNKPHAIVSANTWEIVTETMFVGDSSGKIRTKGKSDVRVEDRPLALSVYEVFNFLFESAGYQVVSTFTESTFFKRLFFLPGKEKQDDDFTDDNSGSLGLLAEYYNASFFSLYPFPFDIVVSDPGSHFTTPSRFTADKAMLVNFRTVFRIKALGSEEVSARILYTVNGSITYHANRVTEWQTLDEDYQTIEQEAELRLQTGDYVEVQLILDDTRPLYVSPDETLFEATVTDAIIKGSSIVPGDHLPDIKQLDFIKAIRHLFNLYFFTDVNMRKVYIEPRDTFFVEDQYIDLSEKLDIGKEVIFEELGSDVNKKLIFGYKKDSGDWGIGNWEKEAKRSYSRYETILLNRFSKDQKEILNTLFAATLMDTFDCIGLNQSKVPTIWKEPEDSDGIPEKLDEYEPRILYFAGETTLQAGEAWNFEGTDMGLTYPLFASWYGSANQNSLMFDDRSRDREMFTRYYANHVRTLNESRKITAYFNLKPSDIQPFITPDDSGTIIKDYRSKVLFLHRGVNIHARIESISDFRAGAEQTTKVILITDSDNTFIDTNPEILELAFINNLARPATHSNGGIYQWGPVWATVRSATEGRTVYGDESFYKAGVGSRFDGVMDDYWIERIFLSFDTSAIPDTAVIVSAKLEIYKNFGDTNQEISIYEGLQADTLTKYDFDSFGTQSLGESVSGNLGLRNIDLNSYGLAVISKTGWTKFCLREKYFDSENNAPTGNYNTFRTYMNNPIAGFQNRLVVRYYIP